MESLIQFGWSNKLQDSWNNFDSAGAQPGRVVADFGTSLKVAMPQIITAELSGKLAHHANKLNIPKVGDWVAVNVSDNGHAVIVSVMPRLSEVARKAPGRQTLKQVIAANIDVAFVLLALDSNFNVDRLRRFLYQLSISNISPVIVLNKADKTDNLQHYITQLSEFKLPIVVTTATQGQGIPELLERILPGQTAILLGSSGVGKSTITNKLLEFVAQKTQAIRESDESGKHTTVHRELFVLKNGGLLIDTPGIRELQLWGTEQDLAENFDDVITLVGQCKYTSCKHGSEEGCAVQLALKNRQLDQSHYSAFLKMKAELVALSKRKIVKFKLANAKSKRDRGRQDRDDQKQIREELS